MFFQAEADINGDGCIEYGEFIPIALQIIQTMYAKKRMQKKEDAVAEAVENALVHGMNKEELTACLESIFREVDADGSGTLSREEFSNALSGMELGLTRREINSLMFQIDQNDDGCISYQEFMPLAFDLLRKLTEMRIFETQYQDDDMATFLMDLFRTKDEELSASGQESGRAAGTIASEDVKSLLHEAQLGLTRLQIYSVLSVAEENEEGYISYTAFVPKAVEVIRSMLSFENEVLDQVQAKEEAAAICGAIQTALGDVSVCSIGQLTGAVDSIGAEEIADLRGGLLALGRGHVKGGEINVEAYLADVPGLLKNQRKYSEDVSPRNG